MAANPRYHRDASLTALLDGLEASTIGALAKNDIRSIDDLQALNPDALKELVRVSRVPRWRLTPLQTPATRPFISLVPLPGHSFALQKSLALEQALSPDDLKELGLSVGHRNRLRRRIASSYGGLPAGTREAVAAEDGEGVTSCGPTCLRFALDEQPQACAAAGTHGSNRTTAAEAVCHTGLAP